MTKASWKVDKVHSEIGFSVRHMMISNVNGKFNDFDATINADVEDLTDAEVEFTIDANSIDTNQSARDEHLRSEDFFEVETFPKITFKSTNINKKSDNKYAMIGDLTIRDVTKAVTFDLVFDGSAKDPMSGEEAAGFTGSTVINREEFGLTWNAALEAGGVLVGKDIKINVDIQIRK